VTAWCPRCFCVAIALSWLYQEKASKLAARRKRQLLLRPDYSRRCLLTPPCVPRCRDLRSKTEPSSVACPHPLLRQPVTESEAVQPGAVETPPRSCRRSLVKLRDLLGAQGCCDEHRGIATVRLEWPLVRYAGMSGLTPSTLRT